MTVCYPFISCFVFKNKTVENGEKQQKILSCKNDKNHSAYTFQYEQIFYILDSL